MDGTDAGRPSQPGRPAPAPFPTEGIQPVMSSVTTQLPPVTAELPPVVAEHFAAVNAFDTDRIVATFAPGAYVNDNRREIWGAGAIRKFIGAEIVADHVTMQVREVIDHYGDIIVRARWDGSYDKTGLPDELVVTSYFAVRDGKITSLAIIANQPSPY
jgi:SnoaL-like domain